MVDQQLLASYFDDASKLYSNRLCSVVQKMVDLNAALRVDWSGLVLIVEDPSKDVLKSGMNR